HNAIVIRKYRAGRSILGFDVNGTRPIPGIDHTVSRVDIILAAIGGIHAFIVHHDFNRIREDIASHIFNPTHNVVGYRRRLSEVITEGLRPDGQHTLGGD